jgi:aminoglycoside 3-N-acetyltransferase
MPVEEGGKTYWREFDDIAYGGEDFEALGKAFEDQHLIKPFKIGNATCRLFSQRALVDFAAHWISTHRT